MKKQANRKHKTSTPRRKRAAEALQSERDKLKHCLEAMVDGVYVVDQEHNIQYVNPVLVKDFGAYEGRKCYEYFHNRSKKCPWCKNEDVWAGRTVRWEWFSFKNERTYDLVDTPLRNSDGSIWKLEIFRDITDSKRAAEKLRASEELYRALFEQAADTVFLVDAEGKMVEFNTKSHEALGYTREEFQRLGIADFEVIESPEEVKAHVHKIASEGSDTFETKHRTKRGEIRDIVVSSRAVDVPGPGRCLSICRDITDGKRAAEEMENLAKFPSESPYPILRVAADGTVMYANPAGKPLLKAKGSAVGRPAPRAWRQVIADVLESGSVKPMEVKHAGRIIGFQAVPVAECGYVNLYGRDITDRLEAQQQLRRERDFAASVVDTARSIILVLDADGRIVRFNRFAEELTGYKEQEVLGKDWFRTFIPAGERERIGEVLHRVVDGRLMRGVENPILTSDGREVLVRWYNSTLYDAEGKALGALAIGYDITEVRAKEAQLLQAQKMESVGRLAGGIAHDFRNQLTVIKGYAEMLARQHRGEGDDGDHIEEILKAVDRSAGMTSQLLAFSRKQILRPEVVDLNGVLGEMSRSLGRMIGEDIALTIVPAGDLGSATVDPAHLQQAVLNMVVNSRDAMPKGGRLTIRTANVELDEEFIRNHPGARAGEHVMLSVSDTGAGMDAETLSKVFEPFFTTKAVGEGTGLGLSMVYGFVTQSGGHVTAQSEPEQGTTFTIYLPLTEAPAPGKRPAAESAPLPNGTGTILVVEDEEPIRQLLVRTLRECGYTVMEAGNAREALPLGQHYEGDIDLLITDVVMPGVDGTELAESVRATRPDVKVLYMTGYTGKALSEHGVSSDGANLLVKPFSAAALLEAVGRALRNYLKTHDFADNHLWNAFERSHGWQERNEK